MPLPWVRMDCQWRTNPKFLVLIEDGHLRAVILYWTALGWVGSHGQDGFIPYYALPACFATKKEADQLIAVGLWHPTEGGWEVNGWIEFQATNAENEARSKKARHAANSRWREKNG